MLPVWAAFICGMIVGGLLALILMSLLCMAGRSAPDLASQAPVFDGPRLQPVYEGFTWCPNCKASFTGKACPGCAPNPENSP